MVAPFLSIIIPVYREALTIGRCLGWLAGCPGLDRCEVIVVEGDRGETLTPKTILPVRVIRSEAGRARQMNAGAHAAAGEVLLFLHVDTRPPRSFVRLIGETMRRHDAGAFDLHIETGHPFVRAVSLVGLVRSRLTQIPYGDQAQFIRRRLFDSLGSYPNIPLMEDVVLMLRVRRSGSRVALVRPPARTSDRRWTREGAVRTTVRNWRIMIAFRAGVPAERLASRYPAQYQIEHDDIRLVVFHRTLRPGRVKTRLAAEIGDAAALAVYHAMVKDLMAEVSASGIPTVYFADDPATGVDVPGRSVPQCGDTLWERMDDALRRCISAGARRVVLVGSDIPGLTAGVLQDAFHRLESVQVVLGPSADGGFYLFGCRSDSYRRDTFDRASMRSAEPGAAVIESARAAELTYSCLSVLRDVDTAADLREALSTLEIRSPRLRAACRSHRIESTGFGYTARGV